MTNMDTAKCIRCGREIGINDEELSSWEVIGSLPDRQLQEGEEKWCCEACLTPEEEQAIDDDAMEMAERMFCVRCGRRHEDESSVESMDEWLVDDEGNLICPDCQTHEDRMTDMGETIAGLKQMEDDVLAWKVAHPIEKGDR